MSRVIRTVLELEPEHFDEAAEVLFEAFLDYPAMRFFFQDAGADYGRHVRALIDYSTLARRLRGDPILAIEEAGSLVATAYLVRTAFATPPALAEDRERLWHLAGATARRRYEDYGEATARFAWPEPHVHLSLIGVRREHSGEGYARLLMDAVWEQSRLDPASRGVSLSTEKPANLSFYEHFGFQRAGYARVGTLDVWGFFRSRPDRSTYQATR